jgi:hypothetical protein
LSRNQEIPQARQIEEAVLKKYSNIPDDFGRKLADELLSGNYLQCSSLNGLVKQFADRCVSVCVHGKVAHVVQGPAPDQPEAEHPVQAGEIIDLVADWNGALDFQQIDGYVWARCLEPALGLAPEPAWEPAKKGGIR